MKKNISYLIGGIIIAIFVFSSSSLSHEASRFSKIGNSGTYWDNTNGEVVKPCSIWDSGGCDNCHTSATEQVPSSRFHPIFEKFYWDYANKKMVKACPHHLGKKDCTDCHKTLL